MEATGTQKTTSDSAVVVDGIVSAENGGTTKPPEICNSVQFYQDLIILINKHSMENQSDTPDHILADYIMNSLMAFTAVTLKRDKWWSFETWKL